jgi:exopolysaccharide production protein ExoZ
LLALIQAYRGFAALLVVLYHANVTSRALFGETRWVHAFDFGWAGVQFFFVLSGFIICYVHRQDIGKPEALATYARKRVVRIYPLYWIVTLALAPLWLFVPAFGEDYHKSLTALGLSLALLPQPHPPHLDVAWTLIHEVIFYAAFAVLILHRKIGYALLAVWFAAVCVANLIADELAYPANYLLSPNNLLFGLGMLAAFTTVRLGWAGFLLGNGVFLAAGIAANSGYDGTALIFAFGLASFAIILSAVRLDNAFHNRALRLMGDASYATYLVHYPAISAVSKVLPADLSPSVAFVISATFGVGCGIAAHLVLERPLLNFFRKGRAHQLFSLMTSKP